MMWGEKYFIVTCHGWSGSHWLATALNSHPEVICCHSALNILADTKTWADDKLKKTIVPRQNARLRRGVVSTDELFKEVKSYGKAKVYGNVHTLRIRDLPEINSRFRARKSYALMNMVRHPVSLVASGAGQLREMMEWDIYALLETSDAVREEMELALETSEKYGINLCDNDNRAFITACHHQKHLARDHMIAPDIPTIIMERVVSERAYYAEIFEQLTSKKLKADDEYLDNVFSIGKLNPHKAGAKKSPEQEYAEWPAWQKEVFGRIFSRCNLRELYQKFGYDFSFIV